MTDTTNANHSDSLAWANVVVLERCVGSDADTQQGCDFLIRNKSIDILNTDAQDAYLRLQVLGNHKDDSLVNAHVTSSRIRSIEYNMVE